MGMQSNKDFFAELENNWLRELYNSSDELSYETLLGFEDFLGNKMCFVGGFSKEVERRSMCAYGTILQFNEFDECLKIIGKDKLTPEKWRNIVSYFRRQWYLSPIAGMVAAGIARFAGLPDPLNKDEETEKFYS